MHFNHRICIAPEDQARQHARPQSYSLACITVIFVKCVIAELPSSTQIQQFFDKLLCYGNDARIATILGGSQHQVDQVLPDVRV
jgi:hypothetical protein